MLDWWATPDRESGLPQQKAATMTATPSISNQQFADAVDIHFSMASRLRSGQRLPSADLIKRISDVYGIPLEDLHRARSGGPKAFGKFLCERVLDSKD